MTREDEVDINTSGMSQDVEIHLKGDLNGDGRVNISDVSKANLHVKGKKLLTGYEFDCADVTGDRTRLQRKEQRRSAQEIDRGILSIAIPVFTYMLSNIIYESFKAAFIDVQKIDGLNGGVSLSLGICLIIISLICRYGAEATGDKKSGS